MSAAATDDDGRPVLELREPLDVKGELLDRIVFHPVRVGDMRALDKVQGQIAQGIALVAKSAKLSTQAIDALDARDFQKALEIVVDFFGVGLPADD